MRLSTSRWLIIATALLAFGCSSQKEPAEKAVAQIETSVASIREDAAKYAPEELASVDASLTAAKDKLAKKDYKAVLADTGQLNTSLNTLKETVAEKKAMAEAAVAAANEQWTTLSADVPKMVAAIQSRVDVLSKSLGSKNAANVAKATQSALQQLRLRTDIYRSRGLELRVKVPDPAAGN